MRAGLYEAIVVDGLPDPARPGCVKVRIPELFGELECPHLITPLFPGAVGGWQSTPGIETPEGEEERILVLHLGGASFRWLGTSQGNPDIEKDPLLSGARSHDGKSAAYLHDEDGVRLHADDGNVSVTITPDGTITLTVQAGHLIRLGSGSATSKVVLDTLLTSLVAMLPEVITAVTFVAGAAPNTTALMLELQAEQHFAQKVVAE